MKMEEAEIRLFIYSLQDNLIRTSRIDEVRKPTDCADVGPSHRKMEIQNTSMKKAQNEKE